MITTARLRLSPFSPQHVLALIESPSAFHAQSGLIAAEGLRDFYTSGEISAEWLDLLRTTAQTDPWVHGFAVIHRDQNSVIGTAGFKGPPDDEGMAEIAYGIVPGHQNRGYATEAAAAIVAFASANSVRLIRAHTLPEPNASTRVLTKCSFQCQGEVIDPEDGPVWRWERMA